MRMATKNGFNYRGLKLAFAGLAIAILACVPPLIWGGSTVLLRVAYAGFVVGWLLGAYGLVLHWREFIKAG